MRQFGLMSTVLLFRNPTPFSLPGAVRTPSGTVSPLGPPSPCILAAGTSSCRVLPLAALPLQRHESDLTGSSSSATLGAAASVAVASSSNSGGGGSGGGITHSSSSRDVDHGNNATALRACSSGDPMELAATFQPAIPRSGVLSPPAVTGACSTRLPLPAAEALPSRVHTAPWRPAPLDIPTSLPPLMHSHSMLAYASPATAADSERARAGSVTGDVGQYRQWGTGGEEGEWVELSSREPCGCQFTACLHHTLPVCVAGAAPDPCLVLMHTLLHARFLFVCVPCGAQPSGQSAS